MPAGQSRAGLWQTLAYVLESSATSTIYKDVIV